MSIIPATGVIITNGKNISMKVWAPDTSPEHDIHIMALGLPDGLQFFLEALANGHTMFGVLPFTIVAYRAGEEIGRGVYQVVFEDVIRSLKNEEPIKLITHYENGEMVGIMFVMWQIMRERLEKEVWEEVKGETDIVRKVVEMRR